MPIGLKSRFFSNFGTQTSENSPPEKGAVACDGILYQITPESDRTNTGPGVLAI